MTLAAIDPGASKPCAVAGFDNLGRLTWVELVDSHSYQDLALLPLVAVAVYEKPQIDGRTPDPQVYIDLAAAGATVAGRLSSRVVPYEPRAWKSSQPKPQHHSRVLRELKSWERLCLEGLHDLDLVEEACLRGAADAWAKPGESYYSAEAKKDLLPDILDAIGLGLYHLGRLDSHGRTLDPWQPPSLQLSKTRKRQSLCKRLKQLR